MASYNPAESKLELFLRLSVPHLLMVFLLALNLASTAMPYAGLLKPDFLLPAIYYWALYRPTLLPPAYTFLIGLVVDLISGFPVGLHAVSYIAVDWVISGQRRFLMGQSYPVIWLGFVFTAVIVAGGQWLLMGLFHLGLSDFVPVFVKALMTVLIFPLLVVLLLLTHRVLPGHPKSSYPPGMGL